MRAIHPFPCSKAAAVTSIEATLHLNYAVMIADRLSVCLLAVLKCIYLW